MGKVKPPGAAPWLYRSHETEQFDDIVLRPKAEVSAVWDLLPFLPSLEKGTILLENDIKLL